MHGLVLIPKQIHLVNKEDWHVLIDCLIYHHLSLGKLLLQLLLSVDSYAIDRLNFCFADTVGFVVVAQVERVYELRVFITVQFGTSFTQ